MVRNYVKKGHRQLWSEETMRLALEAVMKHGFSRRKAAIAYHIPQATLARKLSLCRGDPVKEDKLMANPKGKTLATVFNKDQENLLCHYLITLEQQLTPFFGTDIRRIAFQIAEKFQVPHRFKKDTGLAGEDWYRGFLKRNPNISVNSSSPIFNKSELFSRRKVYNFFDLLEDIVKRNKLEASNIYTCGETVITCAVTSDSEAESIQEYNQSQNEYRELVTAQLCFSASGAYAPLLMVFPRRPKCLTSLQEVSPGAWVEYDESGQMQLLVFIRWLKKFIEFSRASKDSPVLLILDNYQHFLKNLEVLEIADENGVHILCIPLHCSEKLHPMYHNFMKLLSEAYTFEVSQWSEDHPACNVSIHEVSNLFGSAFTKVSLASTPINSFRDTGLWPPNRDCFEGDFIVPITIGASGKMSISSDTSLPTKGASMSTAEETAHEPIVVITSECDQSFVTHLMEDPSQIDQNSQQCSEQVSQQSFNDPVQLDISDQAVSNRCRQEAKPNTIVIPPEAALTEIKLCDLPQLMQTRTDLYFYVSPNKLELSF